MLATGLEVSFEYEPPDVVLTYTLYPVTLEVLAVQLKVTEWEALAPVPEREMVSVPFEALLAMLMLPLALPVLAGLNVAVSVTDLPAATIVPADTPLALKPAPDSVTFEMVTLAVPAFVRVTVLSLLLETSTEPKFKLLVLAFRIYVPFTVRTAALLTTLLALLPTRTVNCEPLSEMVVAGVV